MLRRNTARAVQVCRHGRVACLASAPHLADTRAVLQVGEGAAKGWSGVRLLGQRCLVTGLGQRGASAEEPTVYAALDPTAKNMYTKPCQVPKPHAELPTGFLQNRRTTANAPGCRASWAHSYNGSGCSAAGRCQRARLQGE